MQTYTTIALTPDTAREFRVALAKHALQQGRTVTQDDFLCTLLIAWGHQLDTRPDPGRRYEESNG
jgi:hypothetical protein